MKQKVYLVAVGTSDISDAFETTIRQVFQHLKDQRVRLLVDSHTDINLAADFLQRAFHNEHVIRCEAQKIPMCIRLLIQNTNDHVVVMATGDILGLILRMYAADSEITISGEVPCGRQPYLYDPITKTIAPLAA